LFVIPGCVPPLRRRQNRGGQVNRAVGKKLVPVLPNASLCFVVLIHLLRVGPVSLLFSKKSIPVFKMKKDRIIFKKQDAD
jgi:hypothetical protein